MQAKPALMQDHISLCLKRVAETGGRYLYERSFCAQMTSFERQAALVNEREMLRYLAGRGAVTLDTPHAAEGTLVIAGHCADSLAQLEPEALSGVEKIRLFKALVTAVSQIHDQDVLHLSLRPSVFLISPAYDQAELVDLSYARHYPRKSLGLSGFRPRFCDPHFLAPEQGYQYDHYLDQRTDLYSLGCILFWLLSGEKPYQDLEADHEISYAHLARELAWSRQDDSLAGLVDIAHKLLAKDPIQRYQSCAGLMHDLNSLNQEGTSSVLVGRGLANRLLLPRKLYGRAKELDILMAAFDAAAKGTSQALLVAGYSGVGKSALVYEIQKPVLKSNGLFVTGKFDQYQNTPYSAISQALTQFVRSLLSLPTERVDQWRERLSTALHPNGQIIVDLIPELGLLLDDLPDVPELGGDEQQNRFNQVFVSFIRAICTEHKPVAIFIDDLQWADAASINLLRLLLSDEAGQYCLLLGAYRDNEVDHRHPFISMLAEVEDQTKPVRRIELQPLGVEHINALLSDTLSQTVEQVVPLGRLLFKKTGGNPFFLRQFIQELYHNSLLYFDAEQCAWAWDSAAIEAQSITDNVVDLMVRKIDRLPAGTARAMSYGACIGASFPIRIIGALEGEDAGLSVQALLAPSVRAGLLVMVDESGQRYRFLHDRVQQAAYSLIAPDERQALHYRIGQLLAADVEYVPEDDCFELARHWNNAQALLTPAERQQLIATNRLAAKRAKKATAYNPAAAYLDQLFSLVGDNFAAQQYCEAALDRLECLYLSGAYERAEALKESVLRSCVTENHVVTFNVILITQYTRYGLLQQAIEQAMAALNALEHPLREGTMENIGASIERAQVELAEYPFEVLVERPDIDDPHVLHIMDILMAMQPCCYNSGSLLFPLTILELLHLTVRHGNSHYSAYVFMMYGLMGTKVLKDYETAFSAAQFSQQVQSRYVVSPIVEGRLRMMLSNFILPWQAPLAYGAQVRDAAFQQCFEHGDYYWGVHAYIFGFYADLFSVSKLSTLLTRTRSVNKTCMKIDQPDQVYLTQLQTNLLSILSGELDNLHSLEHHDGFESEALAHYQATRYMCGKYDRQLGRLLQGYLFGSYRDALAISLPENQDPTELDEGIFHEAVYVQFNLLTLLAIQLDHDVSLTPHQQQWFVDNLSRVDTWFHLNPDTFAPGYWLIQAEYASVNGDDNNAVCYLEKAMNAAETSQSALWQGITQERAGKQRLRRGQVKLGCVYLEQAADVYRAWGAVVKAQDCEQLQRASLPLQNDSGLQSRPQDGWRYTATACQDIAQTISFAELNRRLLHWSASVSGAQYCAIYTYLEGQWICVAQRLPDGSEQPLQSAKFVPQGYLNLARHKGQTITLKDAQHEHHIVDDVYITHVQPRSLCCLPLVNTEPSISVMVLEHRETPNLFSSRRLEVLELFAAQYAISFENIRLYEQLQQQNDQLEHTVAQRTQELERKSHYLLAILDALPMPYALTTLSGECISSNALLNERLEVPPDQLAGQSMVQFYDSPEDRQRFLAQLEQHGSVSNFECRLRTQQQQRFWALVSATYVDLQDERVIFSTISDFSEYKALEKQLYQEANTDALTGILNRRAWLALAAKQQTAHPFRISCILMIDLDHFKALNDNYGHAAGDEVLRQFTTSIQRELREDDLFGRMGGEEFAIVFGGLDLDRAYSAAERLRTMIAGLSVMIDAEELRFTFSAGLCRLRPSEPVTSALKRADKGLYQAKASGRNQVWFEKEDAHRPDI